VLLLQRDTCNTCGADRAHWTAWAADRRAGGSRRVRAADAGVP
jgi:hypothetical protein